MNIVTWWYICDAVGSPNCINMECPKTGVHPTLLGAMFHSRVSGKVDKSLQFMESTPEISLKKGFCGVPSLWDIVKDLNPTHPHTHLPPKKSLHQQLQNGNPMPWGIQRGCNEEKMLLFNHFISVCPFSFSLLMPLESWTILSQGWKGSQTRYKVLLGFGLSPA